MYDSVWGFVWGGLTANVRTFSYSLVACFISVAYSIIQKTVSACSHGSLEIASSIHCRVK